MSYLVLRERYDVGELLAPADLVEQGLVTDALARVAVHHQDKLNLEYLGLYIFFQSSSGDPDIQSAVRSTK